MFGRYPNRRLTLRDVLRVRFQRALLMVPVVLLLELGGVLPALRAFVAMRGPEVVAGFDALAARRTVPPPAECGAVTRGAGIVFHRTDGC